jgi:hypothetical protein
MSYPNLTGLPLLLCGGYPVSFKLEMLVNYNNHLDYTNKSGNDKMKRRKRHHKSWISKKVWLRILS